MNFDNYLWIPAARQREVFDWISRVALAGVPSDDAMDALHRVCYNHVLQPGVLTKPTSMAGLKQRQRLLHELKGCVRLGVSVDRGAPVPPNVMPAPAPTAEELNRNAMTRSLEFDPGRYLPPTLQAPMTSGVHPSVRDRESAAAILAKSRVVPVDDGGTAFMAAILSDQKARRAPAGVLRVAPMDRLAGTLWGAQ